MIREELWNFVKDRALRTKSIEGVCRFILEGIFSRYDNIDRMKVDRGKLNVVQARSFFESYGVKFSLITIYNPKENGKGEREYLLIINALLKTCYNN